MTVSVYSLDDAFSIVRLNAGSVLDGNTFGNNAANSEPTAVMIVKTRSEKETPSRLKWFANNAAINESAARAVRMKPNTLKCATRVQTKNAAAKTVATTPTLVARALARSLMLPSVFKVMKTKPWVKNKVRVTRPPSNPYGFKRVNKVPV